MSSLLEYDPVNDSVLDLDPPPKKQRRPLGQFLRLDNKIIHDKRLNFQERVFLSYLIEMSRVTGFCWMTNDYLAEKFGRHTRSITRWVRHLADSGFIRLKITVKDEAARHYERKIYPFPELLKERGIDIKEIRGYHFPEAYDGEEYREARKGFRADRRKCVNKTQAYRRRRRIRRKMNEITQFKKIDLTQDKNSDKPRFIHKKTNISLPSYEDKEIEIQSSMVEMEGLGLRRQEELPPLSRIGRLLVINITDDETEGRMIAALDATPGVDLLGSLSSNKRGSSYLRTDVASAFKRTFGSAERPEKIPASECPVCQAMSATMFGARVEELKPDPQFWRKVREAVKRGLIHQAFVAHPTPEWLAEVSPSWGRRGEVLKAVIADSDRLKSESLRQFQKAFNEFSSVPVDEQYLAQMYRRQMIDRIKNHVKSPMDYEQWRSLLSGSVYGDVDWQLPQAGQIIEFIDLNFQYSISDPVFVRIMEEIRSRFADDISRWIGTAGVYRATYLARREQWDTWLNPNPKAVVIMAKHYAEFKELAIRMGIEVPPLPSWKPEILTEDYVGKTVANSLPDGETHS